MYHSVSQPEPDDIYQIIQEGGFILKGVSFEDMVSCRQALRESAGQWDKDRQSAQQA